MTTTTTGVHATTTPSRENVEEISVVVDPNLHPGGLKILHFFCWKNQNYVLSNRDVQGRVIAYKEEDWCNLEKAFVTTLEKVNESRPNTLKPDQLKQLRFNADKNQISYLDSTRKAQIIKGDGVLVQSFTALKNASEKEPTVIEYEGGKIPEDRGFFSTTGEELPRAIFKLRSGDRIDLTDMHHYLYHLAENHNKQKKTTFHFAFHPPIKFEAGLNLSDLLKAIEAKQKATTRFFLAIEIEDGKWLSIEVNFIDKKISYYSPNEKDIKIELLLNKLKTDLIANTKNHDWEIEEPPEVENKAKEDIQESGVDALIIAKIIVGIDGKGTSFRAAAGCINANTNWNANRTEMADFLETFNVPPADPNAPPPGKFERFKFWKKKPQPAVPNAPAQPQVPVPAPAAAPAVKLLDRFKNWFKKKLIVEDP